MRGASLASLHAAQTALHARLRGPVDGHGLAGVLFGFVDALDASPALARALTNPNRAADPKRRLVADVLAGQDATAIEIVSDAAIGRWSRDGDLAGALEHLAFEADLATIQTDDDALAAVEDELFAFSRLLVSNRALRTSISDARAAADARVQLVQAVVAGKVLDQTDWLLRRVAKAPRGRTAAQSLHLLGEIVAQARRRLVATVVTATALNPAQIARLGKVLTDAYGHTIHINITVDPAVIGGLRIRVGDDVVDGTILTKLSAARRALGA